jgi:hypothetical protein
VDFNGGISLINISVIRSYGIDSPMDPCCCDARKEPKVDTTSISECTLHVSMHIQNLGERQAVVAVLLFPDSSQIGIMPEGKELYVL